MPDLKYEKYIVTQSLSDAEFRKRGFSVPTKLPGVPYHHRVAWMDDSVVKGSFYMEVELIEPGTKSGATTMPAHTHEYDEIIGFIGTNPKIPGDMGGEVEIWLEDENYIINKTCVIFVPKGLRHCPLTIKKVNNPVVHFTVFNEGGDYVWRHAE